MADPSDRSAGVISLLSELIRNQCVNDGTPDSGHEHRSVATLDDFFGRVDSATRAVVEPHPGRQSVVYRLRGYDPEAPTLMLMGHLDVVPVNAEGWTQDPFGGDVIDGSVWGRGAVDMLNQTSAMAEVFRRHAVGESPPLPGDLVFLGVADEEHGGTLGAKYLVEQRWDLVACDFQLTEIASPSFATPTGPAIPVTVAEKGPAWRHLTAHGVPGHASQPHGRQNALVPLAEAVRRLADAPAPVLISDEWRAFVAGLHFEPQMTAALLDPDRIDDAIETIAIDDPGFARWVHACTHLTLTPTVFHSGMKANVVPDSGEADVDVRKLPGQDEASVDDHFRKALGPDLYDELDIELRLSFPATSSPTAGPLWEALQAAVTVVAPSAQLLPSLIPVSTDARFFRERGVVAYGVGLFDDQVQFGDLLAMFHGHDERVSVRSVELTTDLLAETVAAFGRITTIA